MEPGSWVLRRHILGQEASPLVDKPYGDGENPALTHHTGIQERLLRPTLCSVGWDALGGSRSSVTAVLQRTVPTAGRRCHWGQSLAAEGQREWPSLAELFRGDFLPARHLVTKASLLSPFPQDYMVPEAPLSYGDCKSPQRVMPSLHCPWRVVTGP